MKWGSPGISTIDENDNRVPASALEEIGKAHSLNGERSLQDIVRELMVTLLDTYPELLTQGDLKNLQDGSYCKTKLGLNIGNFPLLREADLGRVISGHSRYWQALYGGHFYVCSQWWKDHHKSNANALQAMVSAIIEKNRLHPGKTALQEHWRELKNLAERNP